MRRTKIICTIGPSCSDEKTLNKMFDAGMDIARLNFSHGTHEDHKQKIDLLKKIRKERNQPLAIMLDTKGPEYRIGLFEDHDYPLKAGDKFTFTTDEIMGTPERVSVSYKNLHNELAPGDRILVNNGLLEFTVEKIEGHDIICNVDVGGDISNRKSMSFPNKVLNQTFLSEQDKADLLFGIQNDIDCIACSFVSTKRDILDAVEFLNANGADNKIAVVAKIENRSGIDNVEDICSACDGIMIGRGDMGVEIPFEELPQIQKNIITKCRLLGKGVITATEMLESMIKYTRPTRAEVSDVANAVFDGTSVIMLSGETASGKHPVLALQTMAKIAEKAEQSIDFAKWYVNSDFVIKTPMDALSHSVCGMAMDIDAKAIVVLSLTGNTARMISRFRTSVDVLTLVTDEKVRHQLSLAWGVKAVLCEEYKTLEEMFRAAVKQAKDNLDLNPGDRVIITGGEPGKPGTTSLIHIWTV